VRKPCRRPQAAPEKLREGQTRSIPRVTPRHGVVPGSPREAAQCALAYAGSPLLCQGALPCRGPTAGSPLHCQPPGALSTALPPLASIAGFHSALPLPQGHLAGVVFSRWELLTQCRALLECAHSRLSQPPCVAGLPPLRAFPLCWPSHSAGLPTLLASLLCGPPHSAGLHTLLASPLCWPPHSAGLPPLRASWHCRPCRPP